MVGPVAGSIAAGWQASLGSVASGSLFAFLQSAAMGGVAMGIFSEIRVMRAGVAAYRVGIGIKLEASESLDRDCFSVSRQPRRMMIPR